MCRYFNLPKVEYLQNKGWVAHREICFFSQGKTMSIVFTWQRSAKQGNVKAVYLNLKPKKMYFCNSTNKKSMDLFAQKLNTIKFDLPDADIVLLKSSIQHHWLLESKVKNTIGWSYQSNIQYYKTISS